MYPSSDDESFDAALHAELGCIDWEFVTAFVAEAREARSGGRGAGAGASLVQGGLGAARAEQRRAPRPAVAGGGTRTRALLWKRNRN